MILLPPRSTLFPFTTLFRSGPALLHRDRPTPSRHGRLLSRRPHIGKLQQNLRGRPAVKTASPGLFHSLPLSSYPGFARSEEHTSELQSRQYLVCRLLLEKKI